MAKRRKYKKRSRSGKLQKGTIYMLFTIGLFASSILLFASFTRNGLLFSEINDYVSRFFGMLSPLVPLNMLLLALLLAHIRLPISQANVVLGLIVFSIGMITVFRSGTVGQEAFVFLNTLLGFGVTIFLSGLTILFGLIILFNVSIGQILGGIMSLVRGVVSVFAVSTTSLFKTKKGEPVIREPKAVAIKGLKEEAPIIRKAEVSRLSNDARQQLKKEQGMGEEIILNEPLEIGMWEYPPITLLSDQQSKKTDNKGDVKKIASTIEKTLESFGIQTRVAEINVGPSVTQYALEIALGTKLAKITALANDLALATEAPTGQIRIEAPIPGRSLVGIEIPNRSLEIVTLRRMLETSAMQKAKSKLAVPLGLDVSGNPIVTDITKMPHVLIAGTTGSGKSILLTCVITSVLFRASPSEVKLILIDPKRVEMTGYRDIPHLLCPVVVEPEQSVSALKWALKEMDRRYIKFAEAGVRNIDSYNELAGFQALPYIVIIIDELADLMALAAVEVEDSIARLAQMARATGIHLVLATQRPSVDVITGLIKANIPCRIAFNVSSMIDSKVIIDTPGAEKLLGRGDMLYVPPDQAKPTRIQGTFVADQDVKRVVNFIKSRGVPVQYTSEVTEQRVNLRRGSGGILNNNGNDKDELFSQAVRIVCQYDRASSSLLQRRLQIGFNRAARILEQLEEANVVGPGDGSKPREVLVKNPDEFLAQMEE